MLPIKIVNALLLIILINQLCAETNLLTLESELKLHIENKNEKFARIVHLGNNKYISQGINVTRVSLTLHGSKSTEIVLNNATEQQVLFEGQEANISLQKMIFVMISRFVVAKADVKSIIHFIDNTIIGTTEIGRNFEINGGELIISNLKLKFKNINENIVSQLVSFSNNGGHLQVRKTQIANVTVRKGNSPFGDDNANTISLVDCKFSHIHIGHNDTYKETNHIIQSTNISIINCKFADVENALIGGIINNVNSNKNLLVKQSSFKNCHNSKLTPITSNQQHTDIQSGNAQFIDTTFEDCTSSDFGGAINFRSDGYISITDCKFYNCISFEGKGGALYITGTGKHTIINCKFEDCSANGQQIAEGGSIFIQGGINTIEDSQFKQSKATESIKDEYDDSVSRGGAIMAVDWQDGSRIVNSEFTQNEADFGGAIYLDSYSTESRVEIVDSEFKNNVATFEGGAIYSRYTTLLHLDDVQFTWNQASVDNKGNDLHFSDINNNPEQKEKPNMAQIQQNLLTNCKSKTAEPRVCIDEYGCQYGWIPDNNSSIWPTWAIVLIVLGGITLCCIYGLICVGCCFKQIQKVVLGNKAENEKSQFSLSRNVEEGRRNTNRTEQIQPPQINNNNNSNDRIIVRIPQYDDTHHDDQDQQQVRSIFQLPLLQQQPNNAHNCPDYNMTSTAVRPNQVESEQISINTLE